MEKFDKVIFRDTPVHCKNCGGKLEYKGSGRYKCQICGTIKLDNFGKVREYIEENGPASAMEISMATGISVTQIGEYLRKGRLEVPENSNVFIHCERCGCDIRYGRFCPECARELANDVKRAFLAEDVGERPKKIRGKMRFINQEK